MLDKLSLFVVSPEILLLVMACVIALVDLGVRTRLRGLTYGLTLATLAVVAYMTAQFALGGQTAYAFGRMVVSDPMGNWLKCFATIAVMVTLVYGRPYAADRDMLRGGEMFTLALFALLGMFVMISGSNFLVIYLGLELMTLCSYALVALRRDNATATEAAMKYFVLGAMASGFLLYGISMLYGATGSLDINEVFRVIGSGRVRHQVLVFGLVFIVSGLAFKLGAAPFHMWIPDVYQGAPTAVTLMIGSAPELAAFGIAIRLLVEGMIPLALDWQQMLMLLAVASLLVGNLAAIAQSNLKRMLAYSTIAQMGFVVLGLAAGVVNGNTNNAQYAYSASMFYIITYVLTTLGAFGIILLLAREGLRERGDRRPGGPQPAQPAVRRHHGRVHVLAGRHPAAGGLLRQAGGAAGAHRQQQPGLHRAGDLRGLDVADRRLLLPARGQGHVLRLAHHGHHRVRAGRRAHGAVHQRRLVLILGIVPGGLMALCADAIVKTLAT
jgi:NADH-quinone oxidoreductase subunit N